MALSVVLRKFAFSAALLLAALPVLPVSLPTNASAAAPNAPCAMSASQLRLVRLLVFAHLTTLNDACQSKNFSVLRAKASPSFQRKYSETPSTGCFPIAAPGP